MGWWRERIGLPTLGSGLQALGFLCIGGLEGSIFADNSFMPDLTLPAHYCMGLHKKLRETDSCWSHGMHWVTWLTLDSKTEIYCWQFLRKSVTSKKARNWSNTWSIQEMTKYTGGKNLNLDVHSRKLSQRFLWIQKQEELRQTENSVVCLIWLIFVWYYSLIWFSLFGNL